MTLLTTLANTGKTNSSHFSWLLSIQLYLLFYDFKGGNYPTTISLFLINFLSTKTCISKVPFGSWAFGQSNYTSLSNEYKTCASTEKSNVSSIAKKRLHM